jgi:release factor glutamine methyltransferase
MLVQFNDLGDVRTYFSSELSRIFSANEIRLIFKIIVTKRMNISDTEFMLANDLKFSESDILHFQSVIERLQSNEPFQYIVGTTEFYGVELLCDSRALIPRPETEELVDWVVNSQSKDQDVSAADFCAGSGCIAFALKSVIPEMQIDAVEWSDQALALIDDNCAFTGLDVHSVKFDALSDEYQKFQKNYSIIVSNPPYIPLSDKARMKEHVVDFEPDMALFVENENPFVFYESISKNGSKILRDNGWLYFEIHEDFGSEVQAIMEMHHFVNIELRKDLQGKERMIRGQKVLSHHE